MVFSCVTVGFLLRNLWFFIGKPLVFDCGTYGFLVELFLQIEETRRIFSAMQTRSAIASSFVEVTSLEIKSISDTVEMRISIVSESHNIFFE